MIFLPASNRLSLSTFLRASRFAAPVPHTRPVALKPRVLPGGRGRSDQRSDRTRSRPAEGILPIVASAPRRPRNPCLESRLEEFAPLSSRRLPEAGAPSSRQPGAGARATTPETGRPAPPRTPRPRPMAIPATGALIWIPASISARVEPQTDAMDVEPLDSSTSLIRSSG